MRRSESSESCLILEIESEVVWGVRLLVIKMCRVERVSERWREEEREGGREQKIAERGKNIETLKE